MIRLGVADDQVLVRLGLQVLFEDEHDITLVGSVENGRQAVELARSAHPHVMLMDIRMPEMDGLAALREIVADPLLSEVRVVMLTTFELDDYLFEALRCGASGFLIKDADPGDLLRSVRVAARGEALLSPTVTRRMISEFVRRPVRPAVSRAGVDTLTNREREVVSLVADGLSNDEIAERLFVSPATVRTHVSRAMAKLQARDRAQLVVVAFQTGLAAMDG